MSLYLLDTSALKRAYIAGPRRRRCRHIISRCAGRVFIAEISVLEMVSALALDYRDGRVSITECVEGNHGLLVDIASSRIRVLGFRSDDFIRCRALLYSVAVELGRGLRTQDAIIAYSARSLALAQNQQVRLLTSDKKLAKIVKATPAFRGLVLSEYLPAT